jgi:hypothetical protein
MTHMDNNNNNSDLDNHLDLTISELKTQNV